MLIHIFVAQRFGILWHSSISMHLPPEPSSKPSGQFVKEPVIGVNDVGVVVVIVVILAVVISDVRDCGIRDVRSQRYEPRVFLHWYPDPQSWVPRTHSSSSSQISVAALRV